VQEDTEMAHHTPIRNIPTHVSVFCPFPSPSLVLSNKFGGEKVLSLAVTFISLYSKLQSEIRKDGPISDLSTLPAACSKPRRSSCYFNMDTMAGRQLR
jgi:hypothetical protein